jgi:hypothetical protein
MVKGRVPADPKEEAELAVARVVEARANEARREREEELEAETAEAVEEIHALLKEQGKNGHDAGVTPFPLMTQSGHFLRLN